MKRLTKREQIIFFICVFALVVFIAFNGFIKPMREKIDMTEQRIETQKVKLIKNLKAIQKGDTFSKEYELYLQNYKQSRSNEEVMSSLLAEIEQVANELGLNISDMKPNQVKKQKYYNRFSVSLTMDNQFVDIIHFLHKVQREPHLFDVDQANFEKSSNRNETDLRASIVLSKILIP